MDRFAALPLALAGVVVLAGCASMFPGSPTPTPAPIEPAVSSTFSTGGQCVEESEVGMSVDSIKADGVWTVTVEGNVTVDGAHYTIKSIELREVADGTYRIDVNTTADTGKPAQACENTGIVHYQATVEFPAAPAFQLEIIHDGTVVAGVGSAGES